MNYILVFNIKLNLIRNCYVLKDVVWNNMTMTCESRFKYQLKSYYNTRCTC